MIRSGSAPFPAAGAPPAAGRRLSRRRFLAGALAGLALAPPARARAAAPPLDPEVLAFHRDCRVLDLHIDTPLWMRAVGYDIGRRHRNWLPGDPFLAQMDLPRAREGGLDAAVFGVVVNPATVRDELILPLKALARLESGHGIEQTLATLDLVEEAARQYADRMVFARSGSELAAAIDAGRFACLAGLEGAHGLEGSLEALRRAHARGLRMVGLVHFQATEAGFPMTVPAFEGRGLTEFGRTLVAEMDALRMALDLAHLNPAGVDDALATTKRPALVSHTACRALHDNPRNLDDAKLRAVAERGGVVGIAVGRWFLGRPGLDGFLDHVEHALRVGGAEAVAIGSDWDGAIVPARGMGDVGVLPRVTAGLLARGHPRETVRKVMGENALRVLTEVCG